LEKQKYGHPGVNFTNIFQAAFCQFPIAKKIETQNVINTEKMHTTLLYEIAARKNHDEPILSNFFLH